MAGENRGAGREDNREKTEGCETRAKEDIVQRRSRKKQNRTEKLGKRENGNRAKDTPPTEKEEEKAKHTLWKRNGSALQKNALSSERKTLRVRHAEKTGTLRGNRRKDEERSMRACLLRTQPLQPLWKKHCPMEVTAPVNSPPSTWKGRE